MVNVELDIFSGRPNPAWQLTAREAGDLLDQLRSGSVDLMHPDSVESILGYRGFVVDFGEEFSQELERADVPRRFRVRRGARRDMDKVAEQWLLRTDGSREIRDNVREAAEGGILLAPSQDLQAHMLETTATTTCTTYATSSTSWSTWNDVTSDRLNNNCYNYASNKKTGTFAQPGRASGQTFTSLTLSDIKAAMIRDGYGSTCAGTRIVNALWIWPGTDFHYYRKTADVSGQTRWCHKPGSTYATNKDNSGKIITAPATADRGNYNTGAVVLWGPGTYANVR